MMNVNKKPAVNQSPDRRIGKVISGSAKSKPSALRKLTDIFVAEDAASVKNYVLVDVIIPAIKKTIWEIVTGGIDMVLYGGKRQNPNSPNVARVSYDGFYNTPNQQPQTRFDDNLYASKRSNYDAIRFDNRGDAEVVLNSMKGLISQYGLVRVADIYDMCGLPGQFTDNRYGWTGLNNAYVTREIDGWKINLPKAVVIE